MRNDFRFFTPLRSVQNDRGRGVAFGMTKDEGAAFRMTGKGRCVRYGREGALRSA